MQKMTLEYLRQKTEYPMVPRVVVTRPCQTSIVVLLENEEKNTWNMHHYQTRGNTTGDHWDIVNALGQLSFQQALHEMNKICSRDYPQ